MPSTTETQGLVLAEALAAGARVIASDSAQSRDVLDGAGIVTEPNVESFARALRAIPEQPERAVSAAARQAAERFSLDAQTNRTLALYASLLQPAQIA